MNIPTNILTLIAGIALTLISLWYGQNHGLLPVAASAEATQVDDIFNFMMTIATGLFLLIEGVLIFIVIKFRRKPGDQTDGARIEGNIPLEMLWTAIPTVIVFILSIYSFEIYNNMGGLDPMASNDAGEAHQLAHHSVKSSNRDLDSSLIALASNSQKVALGLGNSPNTQQGKIPPLVVDVKGIQYAWLFTYPDNGIVAGDVHIPVGRPIRLKITAGDVIHAFWLPEFRIKQDAIPGREVELTFTATRIGEYPVICAELCGAYHGGMKTVLYVQSQEDYNQWVEANAPDSEKKSEEEVAINPKTLSDSEFLTPYAQEMGIKTETVAQLQALHHH